MAYKQKRISAGLYEYRDFKIEKRSISLNGRETWTFVDSQSGTNYTSSTLKQCKEYIDKILGE